MSDDQRLAEIVAWFKERGYELVVHQVEHGGFFAPFMPIGKKSGVASFTWGATDVEAAEAAQIQFEAEKR